MYIPLFLKREEGREGEGRRREGRRGKKERGEKEGGKKEGGSDGRRRRERVGCCCPTPHFTLYSTCGPSQGTQLPFQVSLLHLKPTQPLQGE
jgi:hypothetical protein